MVFFFEDLANLFILFFQVNQNIVQKNTLFSNTWILFTRENLPVVGKSLLLHDLRLRIHGIRHGSLVVRTLALLPEVLGSILDSGPASNLRRSA